MSDRRYRPDPEESTSAASSPLQEMVDAAVRRISTSIVIAGGLVAIAVYLGGGTSVEAPDYQVTAADGRVYRVETDSGRVIACQGERCAVVLRPHQELEDDIPEITLPRLTAPAPAPAQPAPAQPASQAPAPATAPAPANR
jgi:hypothetical protein